MMMGNKERTCLPLQTRLHYCTLLSTSHLKMCSVNLSGFLNHLGRAIIGAKNKLSLMHSSQELTTKATTTTATISESLCCAVLSRTVMSDCDPMDYSLPGSSIHGIFLARILEVC